MSIKVGKSIMNSEEHKTYCVSIYVPLTELGTEGVQQYFKVTARSKNEALAKALVLDYSENKFWADSAGIPQIKVVPISFCDENVSVENLS